MFSQIDGVPEQALPEPLLNRLRSELASHSDTHDQPQNRFKDNTCLNDFKALGERITQSKLKVQQKLTVEDRDFYLVIEKGKIIILTCRNGERVSYQLPQNNNFELKFCNEVNYIFAVDHLGVHFKIHKTFCEPPIISTKEIGVKSGK